MVYLTPVLGRWGQEDPWGSVTKQTTRSQPGTNPVRGPLKQKRLLAPEKQHPGSSFGLNALTHAYTYVHKTLCTHTRVYIRAQNLTLAHIPTTELSIALIQQF